jgi:hypothetical protein
MSTGSQIGNGEGTDAHYPGLARDHAGHGAPDLPLNLILKGRREGGGDRLDCAYRLVSAVHTC